MAFRAPNPVTSRSGWAILLGAWLMVVGSGLFSPALAHRALTTYEGSKTCRECHSGETLEVFGSAHYQLQGPTPQVPNLGGQMAGKWGGINDFCGYPNINFLFQLTGLDAAVTVSGCGSCHAGRGIPPSPIQTQEQLDNIDCLMCHSDLYKRVGAMVSGQPRFINDPTMDIAAATAAIQNPPSRASCLTRCHVGAGGGAGFKQGDIDPLQTNPPVTLDVHMASTANGGAGFDCLDCHRHSNHHIAGRGNDLRETDLTSTVDCLNCHTNPPHGTADLNRHISRVHCTVCHIPAFARNAATDMLRDFTTIVPYTPTNRYEPTRTFATNVRPAYAWFNGLSYYYKFGTPITLQAGKFLMAYPLGNINDSTAKIHAFKLHQARVGYDLGSLRQIPMKSEVLWETGNIDQALRQGAAAVGWTISGYSFATSQRYYSLYHEVAPAANALQCGDCHVSTGRLDFKALGYQVKATRNGEPLCSSCHDSENANFYQIHNIHVQEHSISCTVCHNFSTAPLLSSQGNLNGVYLLLLE